MYQPNNTSPVTVQNVRAAAYVRMSTEHQQYSTENQLDRIKEYAAHRGMDIVRVYQDDGKSGLTVKGRDQLRQLISTVETGAADFTFILAYDISRWGRFQDADESGYYEYICKRAGVKVNYCAEQFENDGSPTSNIIKSVKRSMAGEYSRELSTKVFQGACRLIQMGYKQGGAAGFGLRRMLIDQHGTHKGVLQIGDQKSLQTDRVILVKGPEAEVETILWMYRAFVREGKRESEIADELNRKGILTDIGRPWSRGTVHQVLTNEKYVGHNVYHRTSCKLKRKHVNNPPEMWVRKNDAFDGIVPEQLFAAAQEVVIARSAKLSNEEMLSRLKDLWNLVGRLSGILVDECEVMPSSSAYRYRFGSLVRAYELVGYDSGIDYRFIEINKHLRGMHPKIVAEIINQLRALPAEVEQIPSSGILMVNQELRVSLVLARHLMTPSGSSRWVIRLEESHQPDITIAARMDESNGTILDYYLLPAIDMNADKLRLSSENGISLDSYRFDNLDYFFYLAKRISILEVA
jgi:DNA invertase Pin-like site-specific DNA recombinase